MASVFENADKIFSILSQLVRRPRKGELPERAPGRHGIPVVCLIGADLGDLTQDIETSLGRARPFRVPHEFISTSTMRDDVAAERGDLPDEWQPIELYRRILVKLAQEYSSASNGRDGRVRFRRFGLVNWLLESTYTAEEPDPQHDRELLRRLRDREFSRRRLFGVLRSPETEVSVQGQVPWWAIVLGLHVFPVVWFRVWRGLGTEYRWLLRQPYMAPRDPGTFAGFAVRLTQPRWGREDPEQIGKLMINAFLEDLRAAYRRRIWRRRAARRTAYCVAFLQDVSEDNGGTGLIRSLIDVRNETGAFDPLIAICSSDRAWAQGMRPRALSGDLYGTWRHKFHEAGRSRTANAWYLPIDVPPALAASDPGYEEHEDRLRLVRQLEVDPPPRWARRRVTVVACVLAGALLGGGLVYAFNPAPEKRWEVQHCGLSRSDPDAATLARQSTGECVGVAPNGYAFGTTDTALKKTLAVIAEQNDEADDTHRDFKHRPVVTLVHLSALLSSSGQAPNALAYVREALQGAASAQRRQLDRRGSTDPVLRIYPASAGSGMRFGPDVVDTVEKMMRRDPSIVGVTGLDQSRKATITTIKELTRVGLPMVATTLSADTLDDHSPMYYQVSPQNRREAAVAAAYATSLVKQKQLERRQVRIVYSADPTDEYSENLRDDAAGSFAGAGFSVTEHGYKPSPAPPDTTGFPGARTVGEQSCGYKGLIFFAGRSEDFETLLSGVNSACGSDPPAFLGGDDVARLAADPVRRSAFPKVPFDFLDFTLGSASCDSESDLYSTMRKLFPAECKQLANTSLDGHASLAFDAVNLYVKAIGQLQDTAPTLPLTAPAVWHSLSSIHGSGALDGESGRIDFGGVVDRQIPLDKLISVQHVDGEKPPRQVGFCGRWGGLRESSWCPPPEKGKQ